MTSISWLVPCVTPLRTKCPPPVPVSQNAYLLIVSPSASLAVNSEDAAKLWPCAAVTFDAVTVGAASAWPVTVKLFDQLPHRVPSYAPTHKVSAPEPAVAIFALTSSLMGGTACDMYSLVPDTSPRSDHPPAWTVHAPCYAAAAIPAVMAIKFCAIW